MFYVVIAYLAVSLLLYILMGGADFGAGILEFFSEKKHRSRTGKLMYEAIGPIWEANHMWLIIVVVILFVGFPVIYSTVSTYLHIPILIMLLGVVARGTAFTFRHYDAIHDNLQVLYSKTFIYASVLTPLFLGIIAGSILSNRIDLHATTFLEAYVYSWLGIFPVLVGFFTVALFGFLAAVFIIGETDIEDEKKYAIGKAKGMAIAALILALVILGWSYSNDISFASRLLGNCVSVSCLYIALALFCWMWLFAFKEGDGNRLRLIASAQITFLFIAVAYSYYPVLVTLKNDFGLSLMDVQGSSLTIRYLGFAMLVGSVFILPALGYLLYSFQRKRKLW
ncbi:MAG: cytochrome ubiquinol oxidase subunit [Sphingobacterium sp.]|jgi:cytochrome d ubiquinol oxidase subunit II|nr:cytochrome ubiquinol oxidase subunit [Sphingobacterium sp.]